MKVSWDDAKNSRKHRVAVALGIFEKARYSISPFTPEDYVDLEQTIQQLKRA